MALGYPVATLPHLCAFCRGGKFTRHIVCDVQAYNPRVPTGLKRCYGAGYLHLITSSCYQRRAVLGNAAVGIFFWKFWSRYAAAMVLSSSDMW